MVHHAFKFAGMAWLVHVLSDHECVCALLVGALPVASAAAPSRTLHPTMAAAAASMPIMSPLLTARASISWGSGHSMAHLCAAGCMTLEDMCPAKRMLAQRKCTPDVRCCVHTSNVWSGSGCNRASCLWVAHKHRVSSSRFQTQVAGQLTAASLRVERWRTALHPPSQQCLRAAASAATDMSKLSQRRQVMGGCERALQGCRPVSNRTLTSAEMASAAP